MQELSGFIKLHRKLLNWEWYDDIYTKSVFLHFLLKVSFRDASWRGVHIPAGSFISSYGKIAEELGISVQRTRTAIERLKSTGEITSKSTSKYTVFTVVKWQEYQEDLTSNQQANQQTANNQSTNNQQHRKNVKECKEGKEVVVGETAATTTTNDEFTLIFKTWGKCAVTRLSERVAEELQILGHEYGAENVVKAINISAERGKVNLGYIKGILRKEAEGANGMGFDRRQAEKEALLAQMAALDREERENEQRGINSNYAANS